MRGDSLYCPLPLSFEPYWWCEANCYHCYFRGLNHVWGSELRPASVEAFKLKLQNGLKNKNPQSTLAYALSQKKTLRIGNKTDPFQTLEKEHLISTGAVKVLFELDWSFVIQTRFTDVAYELITEDLQKNKKHRLSTVLAIISPGWDLDYKLFERGRTTPPSKRAENIKSWISKGITVGVNGEPFIPGFHTVAMFEDTLKRLKAIGVKSYNTYNFHFTPHVAKRIYNLPGVDIEKIWQMNQDNEWKKILPKLLEIATKHNMVLGNPDFVNTGWKWKEQANTCCGIDVPNPCTYNTHFFKAGIQAGDSPSQVLEACWDGTGDCAKGKAIVDGTKSEFYTLKDILK